jgi:hypothetical protein
MFCLRRTPRVSAEIQNDNHVGQNHPTLKIFCIHLNFPMPLSLDLQMENRKTRKLRYLLALELLLYIFVAFLVSWLVVG